MNYIWCVQVRLKLGTELFKRRGCVALCRFYLNGTNVMLASSCLFVGRPLSIGLPWSKSLLSILVIRCKSCASFCTLHQIEFIKHEILHQIEFIEVCFYTPNRTSLVLRRYIFLREVARFLWPLLQNRHKLHLKRPSLILNHSILQILVPSLLWFAQIIVDNLDLSHSEVPLVTMVACLL